MSRITKCARCGGNIVEPAFPGDGDYPVPPMCSCGTQQNEPEPRTRSRWQDDDADPFEGERRWSNGI